MIERKKGQEIYKEIANLGNQIQRQDVKNKVWLSQDTVKEHYVSKVEFQKFLLLVQHELNDESKADVMLMNKINELCLGEKK